MTATDNRERSSGMHRRLILAALGAAAFMLPVGKASAQGTLNLYCSVQIEWCQAAELPQRILSRVLQLVFA